MTGNDEGRAIELEVTVAGTPEQVWEAIATGPGITAWFVPTTVEGEPGGVITQDFGPGMLVEGRVQAWEPPHRFSYGEQAEPTPGTMAFEFLVEARSGGTCVVRVTSSGFGTGAAWESEFWDDLEPNWRPFFDNLRLYLAHFPGQAATQLEVTASHPGDADAVWSALRTALGLGAEGAAVEVRGTTGTVERVGERQALLRLTDPVPGMLSAFAFGTGEATAIAGVRAYLFSADAADYVRREEPGWRAWVEGLSVATA